MSDPYGQKNDRRSNDGRAHLYLTKFVDGNAASGTTFLGSCSEHRQAMRVKFRQSPRKSVMKSNNFWLAIPLALVLAGPAAVAQTSTTQTKAPEAGANSFTEAQAKDRIKKAGFSQVSGLRKDDQGIWRASATKGRCKGQCVCRFPRQRHNPVRSQNIAQARPLARNFLVGPVVFRANEFAPSIRAAQRDAWHLQGPSQIGFGAHRISRSRRSDDQQDDSARCNEKGRSR